MRIKNLEGFTLLEVLVSLTFITLISSSIYLMASFLISSTESISNNYLRKLSYKSYIQRLKIHDDINNAKSDASTQWPLEKMERLLNQLLSIYSSLL